MKVLGEIKTPMYCCNTLVDYYTIYIVDKIPQEREYIETRKAKGYVVSTNYDDETQSNIVYLEKNLDDWNNQLCDICGVVYVKEKVM